MTRVTTCPGPPGQSWFILESGTNINSTPSLESVLVWEINYIVILCGSLSAFHKHTAFLGR